MKKMRNKNNFSVPHNENGRSMVEMLGVLAVMGVLSITGISGFAMAMKKHRANQIITMASTLHAMAVANLAINPTGSGYGNIPADSPYEGVTMEVADADGNIAVTGASPEVCQLVNTAFGTQDYELDCPEE